VLKDILESTDPDALVYTRRRRVEFSICSDRPGMLICKRLMESLAATARPRYTAARRPDRPDP
jgi:hypothetical protein